MDRNATTEDLLIDKGTNTARKIKAQTLENHLTCSPKDTDVNNIEEGQLDALDDQSAS